VSIEIANESGVGVNETSIVAAARFALDRMGVSPLAELSVLLVELDVMADLHERWMDSEGPTDVMSFPMDELDSARRPDAADAGPALLGDIVLCPAFAKEQARKAGHGLLDELHLLTVHGVLHLLGYDHAEPAEEREMFTLQGRILTDFHAARDEATRRAAQRSADDRVLGAVGLTKAEAEAGAEGADGVDGADGADAAAGVDGARQAEPAGEADTPAEPTESD
jgi:probable rRNA maturation factor